MPQLPWYPLWSAADEEASSLWLRSSSIHATRAKVKKQLLKDVAGNHKWRVNKTHDRSHSPFPVKEIIQRAEQRIGEELTYDVLTSNCEHFVTMLRYGEGFSDQVSVTG
ncbi:hypothetical protein EK904_011291 [Melospiza melodia maxima]|nr:hypothetical protein EK904_011291 [Melospiza melodia maxima]